MSGGKRPYRSPRRAARAEATRGLILDTASTLFTTQGYGTTTVEAVAAAAGVSPQTVYSAFKTKRGLLEALHDRMAAQAEPPSPLLAPDDMDPRRQLRGAIAFTTRFYSQGSGLIELARALADIEPDLGARWRDGEARRLSRYTRLAEVWESSGVLATGLTAATARDIAWALGGPDSFRLLVRERGWSTSRYEQWLGDTLELLLFGP